MARARAQEMPPVENQGCVVVWLSVVVVLGERTWVWSFEEMSFSQPCLHVAISSLLLQNMDYIDLIKAAFIMVSSSASDQQI